MSSIKPESMQNNKYNSRINISVSDNGKDKKYTYDFKEIEVSLEELGEVANCNSVSGPVYKKEHRKSENIIRGSNIILIDCDEPGQAEAVESKIKHYDYVKVPSASNSADKPYKWHYIIPTQEALSIYPAAFKWQVEEFFRQVGITDEMIDTTGSYDIARQFAPASIGMSIEDADELIEINNTDLQVPVSVPPKELCTAAAKSLSRKIKGKQTATLPPEHLWFNGNAITYDDASKAVREAYESGENQDEQIIVSGFGCPHNNCNHTGDVRKGYGFAFVNKQDVVMVKCTGNACKDKPYFIIPESFDFPEEKPTFKTPKLTPIHPERFKLMVKEKVQELEPKFQFGENMLSGFYYYGCIYNECLYRNRNGLPPMRLAVPAPTGSAKSVSAKLYLSKIATMGLSGLLVVGKVQNAIDTVREINDMAGKNIAACTFTISQKHPDCTERAESVELENYPIAVITHNMFLQKSHTMDNIDLLKNHDNRSRDCVIIDEHIDFKRTVSFLSEGLLEVIGLVKDIKGWENIDKTFKMIAESEHVQGISTAKHPHISQIMKEGMRKLKRGDGYVGMKKDRGDEGREAKDRDWMIRLMDRVSYAFSKKNMVDKQGKYTSYSVNEDLTNKFGSVVILDATAKASPIYSAHLMNRDDINQIEMPTGIRNYQNATLHICHDKQRRQSKTQLVDIAKEQKILDTIVDSYLSALYPLVSDGSKLLVITFKDIIEVFQSRCKDDNIVFIHWGIHEGTNLYSDFPKVAAIGWFRKSKRKYYEDIDAVMDDANNYYAVTSSRDSDVTAMITGGLAADFVQGFNRARSRVAIDEDGNCAPVDFYMFDDGSHDCPVPIIEKEMPGIKVVDWEPAESYPITKSTIADQRAERIIKWLQSKASGSTIKLKSVIEYFNGTNSKITDRHFKDVINSKLFKMLLDDADIIMRTKRGKYGGTFFDIPEGFEKKLETDAEVDKMVRSMISN